MKICEKWRVAYKVDRLNHFVFECEIRKEKKRLLREGKTWGVGAFFFFLQNFMCAFFGKGEVLGVLLGKEDGGGGGKRMRTKDWPP